MAKKNSTSDLGCFVVLICLVVIVFIFSPGMVVVSLLPFDGFDHGQMWCFSIITSILLYFGFVVLAKKISLENSGNVWGVGFAGYIVLCIIIVWIYLVAHFGFKAEFPSSHLHQFFN